MKRKITLYLQSLAVLVLFQVLFSQMGVAQTYCNPSYSASCTGGGRIDDVVTTGGIINITNIGSNCTGAVSSISDFTATHTFSQMQGGTANISVKITGWACGIKVWIDYNQNGVFDTDELVTASTSTIAAGATHTAGFTIPITATPGITRMRVMAVEGSTTFSPCSSHTWGESEEYTVVIEEAPDCDELTLEAGTLSDLSICPSIGFTLVNAGTTVALGLEREWQSRPVGSTTWTTIAGATSADYVSTTGVTEDTEFRSVITCTATGETVTTNIAVVTINSFLDCYCAPVYTYSCTGGARIEDVITTSGVINISNIATGCTGAVANFSDFTATHTFSQVQGVTSNISVKVGSFSAGVKVWIDYNQNGVYETSEIVAASTSTISSGSTFTASFTVPYTALVGETRMRVRAVESTTTFDACSSHSWGETEEYTVQIIPALPCEDVPLVAGTLSSLTVCPSTSFTIVNSGTSLGIGFVREWQTRPVGSTTWTTIAGATEVNYLNPTGVTVPTEYRCIVSCPTTGEEAITSIATVSLNSFFDCYCTPTYTSTCTGGARINDVETDLAIANISNLGTGCTGAVGSFSDFTSMHVDQIQGDVVEISVTIQSYSAGVKVWVDWNQNGIFEDSELATESGSTITAGSSHTATFTVPPTALVGTTRMRVRAVESTTTFGPCTSHSWGETEDYTFNVIPMPACSESHVVYPDTISVISYPNAVCVSGDVTLDIVTDLPVASGLTYQWQMSTTGAPGSFTNVGGLLTSPSLAYPGITADRWFRVLVYCEGSTLLYTSHAWRVMAVNPVEPTLFDGQHCGPGPVELTGTVPSGFIYWYETPFGGSPVGVGDSWTTPELTESTTYYASAGASPSIDTFVGATPALTSSNSSSPFYYVWGGYKHQYLVTADELSAIGLTAGSVISQIGFNVTAGSVFTVFNDFSISVGLTTVTGLGGGYVTGLDEILAPAPYTPTPGINYFTFPTPIVWDGTSNLVIQTCFNNGDSGGTTVPVEYSNTPGTYHRYNYADGSTYAAICGSSSGSTTTSTQRPLIYINIPGCETDRFPVEAFIRDVPNINILESDGTYCLFNDEFTINSNPAPPAGHTLLWSNGATTPSITVGPSAPDTKYWVEITSEYGCTASDTVTLTLNPSPEVDLGPDKLICEGGTLTLDAGPDGTSYFWNTGHNTREITVEEDGIYTVLVTNSFGCMATDTITVVVDGYAPEISGVIVESLSPNTFRFSAHLPLYVDTYEWDFGDGTPTSVALSPVHTYSAPGTYLVTLRVSSSCATREYTTYANIFTGVDEELYNSFKVYPNPTNDYLNIEVNGAVTMESIRVTNVLGQNVLNDTELKNGKSAMIDVTRLPSGTYHITINTDKGQVVKTFQVVK